MTRKVKNLHPRWDVFVCHASEDKEAIVRPLIQTLLSYRLTVWFDEFEIRIGDSVTDKIEQGLANSNFGIIVLSKDFVQKRWPIRERNAFFQREIKEGRKVLLPIRHGITQKMINNWFPLLSDVFTLDSREGFVQIAEKIVEEIKGKKYLEKILGSKQSELDVSSFSNNMLYLLRQGKIALFNKKRYENRKTSLDFHDQDLTNYKLNGADLSEVNLIHSKLKGVGLEFANLYSTSLMEADLQGANLQYAVIKHANMEKAILKNSFMEYAYLDRADLQYADLTNSSLRYASLECADLRNTIINRTNLYETFRLPITKKEATDRGAIFSYR